MRVPRRLPAISAPMRHPPARRRALSLCTCCRQCPGAAAGRNPRSSHPAVSAFPDTAVGSACTSTFSRLAQRSLALRPAHSRGHQVVTATRRLQPFRHLHDCSDCFRLERIAGWASHPLESAALSRRTPIAVIFTQNGVHAGLANRGNSRTGDRDLFPARTNPGFCETRFALHTRYRVGERDPGIHAAVENRAAPFPGGSNRLHDS